MGPKCRQLGGGKFEMVKMTKKLQNALVRKHNELRKKIADGKQKPYLRAKKMNTLKWNQNLANMCRLNVRQCDMEQ